MLGPAYFSQTDLQRPSCDIPSDRGQLPRNKFRIDMSHLQIVRQNRMNGSVRDANFMFQLHDGHSSITMNHLSHFFSHFFGPGCRRPTAVIVILHLLSILKPGKPVLNCGFL